MEFWFIRHAQPAWDIDGLSVDDPPLTEIGRRQAALLADRLRGIRADRLIVSPLRRARETAEPVAEALGLEPEVHDWLAEIRNPTWEGTPAENVERIFREARARDLEAHWEGLPGGESFRAFHGRVTGGLHGFMVDAGNELLLDDPVLWRLRAPTERVVVVAHAGTNASLIGYLLGIPPTPWEWERFVSFHASVSEVHPIDISDAHAYSLLRFSSVGFLPEDLHSR